jgi:hypothetical protein
LVQGLVRSISDSQALKEESGAGSDIVGVWLCVGVAPTNDGTGETFGAGRVGIFETVFDFGDFVWIGDLLSGRNTNLVPILETCSSASITLVASLGSSRTKLLEEGIHGSG